MIWFRSIFLAVLIALITRAFGLHSVPPTRALEASALARLAGLDYGVAPNQRRHSYVVGVDEAGTGALAGPVMAAAVWLHPAFDQLTEVQRFAHAASSQQDGAWTQSLQPPPLPSLRDSKLLKPAERLALVAALRSSPALAWATGAVPAARTDVVGVATANAEALALAVARLSKKLQRHAALKAAAASLAACVNSDDNNDGGDSSASADGKSGGGVGLESESAAAPVVNQLWCLVDGDVVPHALQPGLVANAFVNAAGDATSVAAACGSASAAASRWICGASAVPGGDRTELVISSASLFAKVRRIEWRKGGGGGLRCSATRTFTGFACV
jgi:ribonuclease HII